MAGMSAENTSSHNRRRKLAKRSRIMATQRSESFPQRHPDEIAEANPVPVSGHALA